MIPTELISDKISAPAFQKVFCVCTLPRRLVIEDDNTPVIDLSVAVQAVERIKRIYHEEGLLKNCTADERYKERQKIIKPLIDEFFAWLEPLPVSGKNKLAEAIGYAKNEKAYLYTFLENGNVPMDNNRAENAIRPFAVGRKNWLFSNTSRGADCSAALYSIVSTAQANNLDAEKYLTELFRQPAGTITMPWEEENED